ncbi:hypothetical protein, partial [Endozoicomonas sp.]|uniref:hypothetical protein n=1 Tax=Endozoicomonas sp. TaxID=1892382 RepID=UPI00383BEDEA
FQGVILEEMKRVESLGVFISSLVETDAVTVSDIAERSGINKMNISRYSRQISAAEDFPAPAYGEKWSWSEVAVWLNARGKLSSEYCGMAKALKNAGNAISVRTLMSDTGTTHFWGNITGSMLTTQAKQARSQLEAMRVNSRFTGRGYSTRTKKPARYKLWINNPVSLNKASSPAPTTKSERSKHHGSETN